jgi:hypothetical protein
VIVHVAKEWNVPPSNVLDWSKDEFMLAVAYLKRRAAESAKPQEE